MNEEAVRRYVQQAQSIIESSPQMDEANTKAAVLRDFLALLDWEIPENTQLEYPVTVGTRTYKVDYALVLEGAPVAFLEAKGVDTPLTEDHREQVAAYMKNKNVNWGILTNGEEYEFLQRQVVNSNVSVQVLSKAGVRQLPEQAAILKAFSKEAIQSGDSEKIASRVNELKGARDTLEEEKDTIATDLTELLTETVSDVLSSHAESEAKEMVDRLISKIEEDINSDRELEKLGSVSSSPPSIGSSHTANEYVVRILEGDDLLVTLSDDNQSELMKDTVDYMIEEYNLISEIRPLPYIPGRKKVVIHTQPTYPDEEEEMRMPKELIDGNHLETHNNKKGKKRTIRRLSEYCGVDVEFSGGW